MDTNPIEESLHAAFPDSTIKISGEGCKFVVEIISEIFADKREIQRQQLVNRVLKPYIQDGTLHAVTIIAKTPGETWTS